MSLTEKEKELVSVGVSLAAGCKPCASHHLRRVRSAGASDQEIRQAADDALLVREEAGKVMQRHGLQLLRIKLFSPGEEVEGDGMPEPRSRIGALVSIGAAVAVNCATSFDHYAAAATELGISDDEVEAVIRTARFIKGKADSLCCKRV